MASYRIYCLVSQLNHCHPVIVLCAPKMPVRLSFLDLYAYMVGTFIILGMYHTVRLTSVVEYQFCVKQQQCTWYEISVCAAAGAMEALVS